MSVPNGAVVDAANLGPVGEPGSGVPLLRAYQPTGSDEHRIETARWALETFAPETALYKQAQKVLANYLAGKPLPKSE